MRTSSLLSNNHALPNPRTKCLNIFTRFRIPSHGCPGLTERVTSGPKALSLVATLLSSSITPGTRAASSPGTRRSFSSWMKGSENELKWCGENRKYFDYLILYILNLCQTWEYVLILKLFLFPSPRLHVRTQPKSAQQGMQNFQLSVKSIVIAKNYPFIFDCHSNPQNSSPGRLGLT